MGQLASKRALPIMRKYMEASVAVRSLMGIRLAAGIRSTSYPSAIDIHAELAGIEKCLSASDEA